MARKRRKKKRKITYDSKETATIVGLTAMLIGLFLGVSVFTITESDSNLFNQARQLFGDATLFAAAFFVLFGLKFLGMSNNFTKWPAILSQALLVAAVAGLFTSFSDEAANIPRIDPADNPGGRVGFFIVRDLFGDIIPTEPATKIVLIVLLVLIVPFAFAMSPSEVVAAYKKAIAWISTQLRYVFSNPDKKQEEDQDTVMSEKEIDKAASFRDFNKLLKQQEEYEQEGEDLEEDNRNDEVSKKPIATAISKKPDDEEFTDFKESDVGEGGLKQEQLKYPDWQLPPLSLLTPFKKSKPTEDTTINQNAKVIEKILHSFNIEGAVEDAYIGPSVIQYALDIPFGVKVKKIATLNENIALALGVDSKAVRIESIPGTTFLGIEVPRVKRDMVRFKELMSAEPMEESDGHLSVPIGKDIDGSSIIGRIEKMPHLLIAGATGSGKSVLTNSFITSLIMKKTPDEVKLILVDPKQVELMDYNGIPHLLTPVITEMDKVVNALKWLVGEMETRYSTLAKEQVRNIEGYNKKKGFAAMPYVVVVIDEMADMMMTANRVEAENAIVRLAQKARAVGIHLILATQRPSVNVITGIIKANIPGRVAMSVTSSTDSRVILDRIGAESLMGQGDMLYKAPDKTKADRLQGSFIEQDEVIRVVDFIKKQAPEIEYAMDIVEKQMSEEEATTEALGEISGDNLVEQAIRVVVQSQKGSSSYLQRRLNIGFNRAARLLEELEEAGVVGPARGSKPREVLISDADGFIAQLRASG